MDAHAEAQCTGSRSRETITFTTSEGLTLAVEPDDEYYRIQSTTAQYQPTPGVARLFKATTDNVENIIRTAMQRRYGSKISGVLLPSRHSKVYATMTVDAYNRRIEEIKRDYPNLLSKLEYANRGVSGMPFWLFSGLPQQISIETIRALAPGKADNEIVRDVTFFTSQESAIKKLRYEGWPVFELSPYTSFMKVDRVNEDSQVHAHPTLKAYNASGAESYISQSGFTVSLTLRNDGITVDVDEDIFDAHRRKADREPLAYMDQIIDIDLPWGRSVTVATTYGRVDAHLPPVFND